MEYIKWLGRVGQAHPSISDEIRGSVPTLLRKIWNLTYLTISGTSEIIQNIYRSKKTDIYGNMGQASRINDSCVNISLSKNKIFF